MKNLRTYPLALLLLVLVAFPKLNAMDDRYISTNTYYGTEIRLDNLLELLESEVPLSPEDNLEIQRFIKEHNLEQILSGADCQEELFTNTNREERAAILDSITKYLQEHEIPHISSEHAPNSIAIIVNRKWVIKRSKVPIARQNVLDTVASMEYGRKTWGEWMRILTREEYNQFINLFGGRVYQNISRAMIYLRARQASRLYPEQRVLIPETHLVHIPGRLFDIDDRNYVVVEEYLGENLTPLEESPLVINEEFILHMVRMIAQTAWWNIQGNAHLVEGQVYYHDHELPNRHDIRHVLFRDVQHYRDLVRHGWADFENMIIRAHARASNIDLSKVDMDKLKAELEADLSGEPYNESDRQLDDELGREFKDTLKSLLKKKRALEQEIRLHWENMPAIYPSRNDLGDMIDLLTFAGLPPEQFQRITSFFYNYMQDLSWSAFNTLSVMAFCVMLLERRKH